MLHSGLKTDLGLLANGSIWGWTVCVIIVAFAGKFVSCGLAAKGSGMDWRESGAVGSLMACKGLVEVSFHASSFESENLAHLLAFLAHCPQHRTLSWYLESRSLRYVCHHGTVCPFEFDCPYLD